VPFALYNVLVLMS